MKRFAVDGGGLCASPCCDNSLAETETEMNSYINCDTGEIVQLPERVKVPPGFVPVDSLDEVQYDNILKMELTEKVSDEITQWITGESHENTRPE